MTKTPNPLLLTPPVYGQLSFVMQWPGVPEPERSI